MRLLETRLFSEENGKSLCKRQSGWFLRIFLPLLLCFFGISHEEIWAAKQKTTFSRERPPKPKDLKINIEISAEKVFNSSDEESSDGGAAVPYSPPPPPSQPQPQPQPLPKKANNPELEEEQKEEEAEPEEEQEEEPEQEPEEEEEEEEQEEEEAKPEEEIKFIAPQNETPQFPTLTFPTLAPTVPEIPAMPSLPSFSPTLPTPMAQTMPMASKSPRYYEEDDEYEDEEPRHRRKRNDYIEREVIELKDEEVIEHTIQYLTDLGVLDESRLDELVFGETMHGLCLFCKTEKLVQKVGSQHQYGICSSCFKHMISNFEEGRSGRRGEYGRDGEYEGRYSHGGKNYRDEEERGDRRRRNRGDYRDSDDPLEEAEDDLLGSLASGLAKGAGKAINKLLGGDDSNGHGDSNANGAGANTGQMVMNAFGQLVPYPIIPADPNAPFGYVRDPITGQFVPAKSLQEGLSAGAAAGVAGAAGGLGQMVMNALGQLVPYPIIPADPNAPFGYVRDPITGQLVPAKSLQEGLTAGAAAKAAGGSAQMVMNALGQLVPYPMIPADPNAPFGYVKDPVTGQLVPAKSLQEGLAAGAAAKAAGGSTQMVMNALGQLVPYPITPADPNAPFGYVRDPITGQLVPAKSLQEAVAAGQAAQNSPVNQVAGIASAVAGLLPGKAGTTANSIINTTANLANAGLNIGSTLSSLVAAGKSLLGSSSKSSSATTTTSAATAANATAGAAGAANGAAGASSTTEVGANAAAIASSTANAQLNKLLNEQKGLLVKLKEAQNDLQDAQSKLANATDTRTKRKAESALNQAQKDLADTQKKYDNLDAKIKAAQQ